MGGRLVCLRPALVGREPPSLFPVSDRIRASAGLSLLDWRWLGCCGHGLGEVEADGCEA